jgi:hypothetical protein
MSYDIFCYKSKLGRPDEEEADSVLLADTDKWAKKDRDAATKLSIVKTLIEFNPRLESFDFDFGEIAKLTVTTIEEEKNKFDHIEINSPEGDPAIRLMVYDNHVHINVLYWYKGHEARKLFQEIKSYIKLIRQIAGYFVFDPQTGHVFDPAENEFDGLEKYLSVSEYIEEIISGQETIQSKIEIKKPWWKLW